MGAGIFIRKHLISAFHKEYGKMWSFPLLLGCLSPIAGAQNTFWAASSVPQTAAVTNDSAAVTLGLTFYSDTAGSVSGVRFYKGIHNTGTHVGTLWTGAGAKLAEVIFAGEKPSGWQQANFSTPISIAARTNYVISYLAPKGYYADDQSYAWSTVNAAPLHVVGSSPGAYAYGSTPTFPTGTWNRSNYWVDLIFIPAGPPIPTSTYSISGTVSGAFATLTLSGVRGGSTTTDKGGNYSFSGLVNGNYLVAPSQSGYTFTPPTASVTINGASAMGVDFKATAVPVSVPHSVSLSWIASASPNIGGYKVYRGSVSGGPYIQVNASLTGATNYTDNNVSSGQTYYYVITAVSSSGLESGYSNESVARIPNS